MYQNTPLSSVPIDQNITPLWVHMYQNTPLSPKYYPTVSTHLEKYSPDFKASRKKVCMFPLSLNPESTEMRP